MTIVWLVVTAPLSRALEPLPDPAMLFLSEEGRPIARRGAIKEAPVELDELDPLTPAAFIAIEDRRFHRHWGIDPRAIGRAFIANVNAGGVRQGGSTITQQLAKTSFLTSNRSLKRKAQEVIIAFWLESWLTKEEILSRYLSSVYFGDGVYGLRAASRHYFDRPPERLTLAQSAMLAGVVQAPSRLAPTNNLKLAQARSRLVLQAMADTGVITGPRARSTRSARPVVQPGKIPTGTYFADWVAPAAQAAFDAEFGQVSVSTTLDRDLQRLAVRAVDQRAARQGAGGAGGDAPRRAGGGDDRRQELPRQPVQPRHAGAPPAGIGVQAVRLPRRTSRRLDARQHHRGRADHHPRLDPGQQRRHLSRPDHAARGIRAVEQCGGGAAFGKASAAATCFARRATLASPRPCPTSRASRWAPPGSAWCS